MVVESKPEQLVGNEEIWYVNVIAYRALRNDKRDSFRKTWEDL